MSDPFAAAADWQGMERSGHNTQTESASESHPNTALMRPLRVLSLLLLSTLPANAGGAAAASAKPKKKGKKSKGGPASDDAPALVLADVELTSPSGAAASQSIRPPSPPSALSGVNNDDYAISVMPSPPAAASAASSNRSRLGMHAESKESSGGDSSYPVQTPLPAAAAAAAAEHFERHIDYNDAIAQSAASAADAAASVGITAASVQTQTFPSNLVRTSKYTAFDFIPRNLFEQFNEPANLYFLLVGILQAIPAISTTAGIPTHYLPLLFIVAVSATRAAYEDYNRHQSDELEGRKKYLVYDGLRRNFVTKSSADIVVGDVVQMVFGSAQSEEPGGSPVSQNGGDSYANYPASSAAASSGRDPSITYSASFPADMLFLSSSHEKGHCFVETASLDGETSLKIKQSLPVSHHLLYVPPAEDGSSSSGPVGLQTSRLRLLDLALDIEAPNAKFDSFKGVAHINPNNNVSNVPNQKVALKAENLLLRGTELRNTPAIFGLVVYTGIDSKIRRNVQGASSRSKKSALMTRVNYLLVIIACLQLSLCFFAAVLCFSWTERNYSDAWYLRFTDGAGLAAFSSFFTWFIILAQLVPISLLVSNELVKAAQAKFIAWDLHMYDGATNQPCVVRNSQLHENLGQIEYIFSDKTGTLTQNKMEFRVGFVGSVPFGSPDSEIARRVAQRMEQLRREQQASPPPGAAPASSSSSGASAVSQAQMDAAIPWTKRVAKLIADQKAGKLSMPAFNDDEKARMLLALWGPKQSAGAASAASSSSSSSSSAAVGPADKKLAAEIRMYLTHMAISNTITPELKKSASHRGAGSSAAGSGRKSGSPVVVSDGDLEDEYILNFSSPDELALCQFASAMGFQFQSRSKDGVQLCIDKQGYGDGKKEIEIYSQLATLDFTSTRKRVTCVYQRENQVFVMCKGADANVLPLIAARTPEATQLRDTLDMQLSDMATKGLRTLVVAGATLPEAWWFGSGAPGNEGMSAIYRATNLPDRGGEKGHNRGECRSDCRICAGLLAIERAADLTLLGATAIEDRLQDLVPEAIDDFLKAGIKVWMLTGDKRETAKNIAMACMLIDPDMEASSDLIGSLAVEDMNRVIEITGDWVMMCNNNDQLRQLFDILDCGGDVVDGYRTGYISKEELRLFLVGLRVPGMDDDRTFAAHWHLVESVNGRIAFGEFSKFIRNLQPSHLKAVQTDIELGLRKARLIAGDGTEDEKRERLEKTPISLVVEGEAFSVFYPDTKVRKELAEPVEPASRVGRMFAGVSGAGSAADRQRAIARRQAEEDEADFSEPEALLLRETFFELASMAKSVICCRLTPAQKGKIVQEFSKRHVTLAIGDGGNDELMIKRASIGVGIAGLEGTAASRASDYAIGSFRFLHTLLFVHGYWCSRRISKLTLFIFYKAALVAFSMYLFGFYSSFSGQQFFNDAIYILFNVCFTALPIIMLAIFDRGGLSASSLENDPRAYLCMANGASFNDGLFFSWILKAFWNAIFVFGVVYLSIGIGDTSGPEGRAHGLWLTSTVVYSIVVLLVTCRILFECESINVFVWFFVIASFAGYFPVVYFASTLERINPNLFGVFETMMKNPLIWVLMAFGVAVPLLVDVSSRSWKSLTKPTYVTVMQERQRLSVADRLRMDQEAAALNSGAAPNHRVRTRTVPHLSQQQKDGQLIAKIRKALEQANHESARQAAASSSTTDSASASDNSQKRAEALVYTMTRFQNLSGSNFDATPQRNILQLYEVQSSLTPDQLEAIRAREAEIAAETQKQHSVQLLKQQQAEKQREEERQRRAEEDQQREWHRQSAEHHRDTAAASGKKKRSGHRASDVGSANELVLNLAASGGDHGDSDSDIVEHEDSEAGVGRGQGRVHLQHQLGQDPDDDEIELSTHDLGDAHDPAHFVFQPRSQ